MKQMKYLESMDRALFSKVNELSGCNTSERSISLETWKFWWPNPSVRGEGSTHVRKVTDTPNAHQRGMGDDMITRNNHGTGEIRLIPGGKNRKLGKYYNYGHEKCTDDERKSDRLVVAEKYRNGYGAKRPNFKVISLTIKEAGLL